MPADDEGELGQHEEADGKLHYRHQHSPDTFPQEVVRGAICPCEGSASEDCPRAALHPPCARPEGPGRKTEHRPGQNRLEGSDREAAPGVSHTVSLDGPFDRRRVSTRQFPPRNTDVSRILVQHGHHDRGPGHYGRGVLRWDVPHVQLPAVAFSCQCNDALANRIGALHGIERSEGTEDSQNLNSIDHDGGV
jgi:hypothetical protein